MSTNPKKWFTLEMEYADLGRKLSMHSPAADEFLRKRPGGPLTAAETWAQEFGSLEPWYLRQLDVSRPAAPPAEHVIAAEPPSREKSEPELRRELLDAYKRETKRHRIRVNHEMLAHQIKPSWNSRAQIDKWLACHPNYNGEHDRLIRKFLLSETERMRKIRT